MVANETHTRQTVLVTGATGFVGGHLCSYLVDKGYHVRGTCRIVKPPKDFPNRMEWVQIEDIGPDTIWHDVLGGIDVVIHLAGLAHQIGVQAEHLPNEFMRVNTLGTRRLAEAIAASASVQRLVFISSIGAVKSFSQSEITESTACDPDTDYGQSKRAAEVAIEQTLADANADWCIIRPVLIYGPGNPGNMARLQKLVESRIPLPFARVQNRRSFLYVGNLVHALERCIWHQGVNRRFFNISDGEDISTPDLIRRIAQNLDTKPVLIPAPIGMLKAAGRFGDIIERASGRAMPIDSYSVKRLLGSLTVSSTAFRQAVDWTPPYSLDEGIAHTIKP